MLRPRSHPPRARLSWRRGSRCVHCCCDACSGGSGQAGSSLFGVAAVAGKTYPAVQIEIDPERVADFARAIGSNPSAGVAPTFSAGYSPGATVPQLFWGGDAAGVFFRPPVAGGGVGWGG